jgi:hypothetical protein
MAAGTAVAAAALPFVAAAVTSPTENARETNDERRLNCIAGKGQRGCRDDKIGDVAG